MDFSYDNFKSIISDFLKTNENNGRLKLVFFRDSGGLYIPNSSKSLLFLDFKRIDPVLNPLKLKSAFVSSNSFNDYNILSGLKPISGSNYILAGLELKESRFDEIIITDRQGYLSECLYSNIWWINNNEVFTPSLETGCVAGVSRQRILNYLEEKKIPCFEVKSSIDSITSNHFVFTSNTFGLSILNLINQNLTKKTHVLFDEIQDHILYFVK